MRKIMPALVCLLALLSLGILIVRVTGAEAPHTSVTTIALGTQGGNLPPNSTAKGNRNAAASLGASPSPTACSVAYTYTVSTGSIVAATNVITSCYQCITQVSLPFPFTFYGQNYTSAEFSSQGNIQFDTADLSAPSCPFPIAQLGPALLPYWSYFELQWGGGGTSPCVLYIGKPCGLYTSVSDSAPSRILNIQWVGISVGSNHEMVNFETRLHEGTGVIDFVYGVGNMFGSEGSVGVQDGAGGFVSYACRTNVELQGFDIHWTPSGGPCTQNTPTPTPPGTSTPTPTRTATATPTSSCPAAWLTIPSQQSGTGDNYLAGVDAISSNNVWAVGRVGINLHAIVQHWDGSQWSNITYQTAGFADKLDAVSAVSANDIWAVGWYEGSGAGTLTEHWNGTQWNYVLGPNGGFNTWAELTAVSARTTNDIWAVGTTDGFGGSTAQPLILHGNGTGWALVGSPTANGYLTGVSALAANDVWAVGNYFEGSITKPMIEHWDGMSWSMSPIPNFTGASALSAVKGISATDVWAVGYASNQTLTMHWDGSAWAIVPSPNVGAEPNYLYGTDARASDDVWAVGKYESSSADHTLTMHWDGAVWTVVPSPSPNPVSAYQAVSMIASNEVWAVGYTNTGSAFHTLTARYAPSGQCFGLTPTPTTTQRPVTATATVTTTHPPATPTSTRTSTTTRTPTVTATTSAGSTGTPTAGVATVTPTACAIHFTDVPEGSTFYTYVRCLACRGIVSGYDDHTFRPANNVTRGQVAKIVSNAAGLNDPQTAQMFQDVPPGSTFFDFIGRLASRGYMSGYPCGGPGEPCGPGSLPYFRPNNNAIRGQISKIVSNAAGFGDAPGPQIFEDVPGDSTFYDYIQRLAHRGVMNGYPCGGAGEPCGNGNRPYFRPDNNATRGQTSKIVSITFFPSCQ